ncbi:xanthine dehydrogenase accessory protein XdhC [Tabrizicola sp. BL-A-41-H6]|uniref:xanthine dehydrogenase accessory protein XdhC n=1 Tax=Tabrizicola sp. BL-A-41-H6 TaxID=3421107 RepID=UPI003D6730DB
MFDLGALQAAIEAHGPVARVVIAAHDGSSPREVGAAMLVWEGGQAGTIGGGALEWEALARARAMLASGGARVDRQALGPALGQCCGGAVTLWTEVYAGVPVAEAGIVARGPGEMPLAVSRVLARARGEGVVPGPGLVQGWLVEPAVEPKRALWIWGAGHVGRALVAVLAPLPGLAITWVDVAAERFPDVVPDGVTALPVAVPEAAVRLAPVEAEHLVLTYSHAVDLALCDALLRRGFASLGLIGSATKWARFRSRLAGLGHSAEAVARIDCPIGNPALGKHPQAIAVGVAAELLARRVTLRRKMKA